MKTGFAVTAATIATLGLAAPSLADNGRWDRDDQRREWQRDQRQRNNAYQQGYRDGKRADDRRDQYRNGNHDSLFPRQNGWQTYNNGNRSYNNNGYNNYPTYRGAAVRGSQPYWWGSNGQIYCKRQDGTAGLIVGALAGGTLGNVIAGQGDKTLGSVIGGSLGAILGNEIAKGNARCR